MPQKVLRIDASARFANSNSRLLTGKIIQSLTNTIVTERDIYQDMRLLSEAMVESNTVEPRQDELINELLASDILVLGVPVYNFGIPASLKAYIDMIVKAGRTFRYGPAGPEGLVKKLQVIVAVTSNGTALEGPEDFVSGYLKCIFNFMGVHDIQFIDATQLLLKGGEKVMREAENKIKLEYGNANFQQVS